MILTASSIPEVVERLAAAARAGQRISAFDLGSMNRVLEYTPEDMTVSVQAGMTLGNLQALLVERGQWLPVDPPLSDSLAIGALLAANRSGPRRYGYGTVREHLLGIKVVLADGRVIKAGGKVVKNVAGYDLCKLFVGSRGTLGVIVEATFKVLPRPETEAFAQLRSSALDEIDAALWRLKGSNLAPVVIDLHNRDRSRPALVVGFSGAREDTEWQLIQARQLGFNEPASLDYEDDFWSEGQGVHCLSVLPSHLIQTLRALNTSFVVRAGNGVVYYRGGTAPARPALPQKLMLRIKETFDPKHLLPDLPW